MQRIFDDYHTTFKKIKNGLFSIYPTLFIQINWWNSYINHWFGYRGFFQSTNAGDNYYIEYGENGTNIFIERMAKWNPLNFIGFEIIVSDINIQVQRDQQIFRIAQLVEINGSG